MSRLLEEFNVTKKRSVHQENDYMIFQDKELLDKFRLQILQDLSDKGFTGTKVSKDLIIVKECIYIT